MTERWRLALERLSRGPAVGFELTRAMTPQWWRPASLAYVDLHRMEDRGLVSSERLSDGSRLYSATGFGLHRLASVPRPPPRAWWRRR